jgi:hypothetical protein
MPGGGNFFVRGFFAPGFFEFVFVSFWHAAGTLQMYRPGWTFAHSDGQNFNT